MQKNTLNAYMWYCKLWRRHLWGIQIIICSIFIYDKLKKPLVRNKSWSKITTYGTAMTFQTWSNVAHLTVGQQMAAWINIYMHKYNKLARNN